MINYAVTGWCRACPEVKVLDGAQIYGINKDNKTAHRYRTNPFVWGYSLPASLGSATQKITQFGLK